MADTPSNDVLFNRIETCEKDLEKEVDDRKVAVSDLWKEQTKTKERLEKVMDRLPNYASFGFAIMAAAIAVLGTLVAR